MFRKLSIFLLVFPLVSCAQLQQVVKNLPQVQQTPTVDIASGLREALTTGIDKQSHCRVAQHDAVPQTNKEISEPLKL